jgi:hypothetical protein
MSARKDLLLTLKDAAKAVRNQSYFVKRGVINWASFNFGKYPLACSIQMDESTLLFPGLGMNEAKVTMEMFTYLPDMASDESAEIDDQAMDNLVEDAAAIIDVLLLKKNTEGDPVVFKIDRTTSRIVEAHDTASKVQGVVVMLDVTY